MTTRMTINRIWIEPTVNSVCVDYTLTGPAPDQGVRSWGSLAEFNEVMSAAEADFNTECMLMAALMKGFVNGNDFTHPNYVGSFMEVDYTSGPNPSMRIEA